MWIQANICFWWERCVVNSYVRKYSGKHLRWFRSGQGRSNFPRLSLTMSPAMRYPVPEEYWGGMVGLLTSVVRNRARGLPVGTALTANLVYMAGGALFGNLVYRYKEDRVKRREVWIWDYVNKHPEDFPELNQSVKYKDILESWTPIR